MAELRNVMTREVEKVSPTTTLKQAAVRMEVMDIGPLPVCDGERLVGILTDRDITIRAVASGRDPNTTPVSEVMTSEVFPCYEDQSIDDAAQMMKKLQVRRLPILSRDGRLAGMVSLADLARHAQGETSAPEVLEAVSQPNDPAKR